MEPVYRGVIGFARVLFRAEGLKFTITGTEHVPRTGGAVMAINHTGYLDFAYAGLAARPAHRLVRFMAKDAVFRHKISGPLMRGMKHIPVDRDAGAASFRAAVTALKQGEIVGVFPEATISRSFELKEFKKGTVQMAASAGVPILPVAIWGSQRVWTKDHPKRLGRTNIPILIAVGEPIPVPRKGDFEAINDQLVAAIDGLLTELRAQYPTLTGDDLKFLPARLGGSAPTPEQARQLDADEAAAKAVKAAEPAAE